MYMLEEKDGSLLACTDAVCMYVCTYVRTYVCMYLRVHARENDET